MKLTYKNYTAKESNGRFDLSFTTKVTAKAETKTRKIGDEYEQETVIGFGYTFETMIKRIVENELSLNNDTITLLEYVNKYRDLLKQITNILNN